TVQVSTLQQNPSSTQFQQACCLVTHLGEASCLLLVEQIGRLGPVGGDQVRARQQDRTQSLGRRLRQAPITALGDHHRVHHHVRQLVPVDRLGDGLGDLGGGEHSDLDRVHARVGQERVELVRDELGGNTVHPGDTAGGLGGEC